MFDFIRKLFSKHEVQTVVVSRQQLPNWINSLFVESEKIIGEFETGIKDAYETLAYDIDILRDAEILPRDSNAEDRVKNIVLGHRDQYVHEVSRFVSQRICSPIRLKQELVALAQRTQKSYQTTTHLFFEPVQNVHKGLVELDKQVTECVTSANRAGYGAKQELEQALIQLEEEEEFIQKKRRQIEQCEDEINSLREKLSSQSAYIQTLQRSAKYDEYVLARKVLDRDKKALREHEHVIHSFFGSIARALRKHQKVSMNQKLVGAYINDPLSAVRADTAIAIDSELEKLSLSLKRGEIDVKNNVKIVDSIKSRDVAILRAELLDLQKKVSSHVLDDTILRSIQKAESIVVQTESDLLIKIRELEKWGDRNVESRTISKIQEIVKESFGIVLTISP